MGSGKEVGELRLGTTCDGDKGTEDAVHYVAHLQPMVLVPGETHPRQAAADAGLQGGDGCAGGVLPQVTVDAEGAVDG